MPDPSGAGVEAPAAVLVPKVRQEGWVTEDVRDIALTGLSERYASLRIRQPVLIDAMEVSMRSFGQLSPLVAFADDAELVLLDGFKRLAAAGRLELPTVAVRVLQLTPRAALAAVFGLNRGGRGLLDLEEALIVRELVRVQGLTQPEAATLLGRHKSWVSRRLSLVERLCDTVQDDVRVGLVTPTVAREVARLPRGNQPEVAAAIHRHGLTSREAATLVTRFDHCQDRRGQRLLLDDPRSVLEQPRPADEGLSKAARSVQQQALQLAEICARLSRALAGTTTSAWVPVERAIVGAALRQARGAVDAIPGLLDGVTDALAAADDR